MRKAIVSTLISALIIAAPGLPCYQASAGMNLRKSIPSSTVPIAGIPSVDTNLKIESSLGKMVAADAAVPGPRAQSPLEPKLDSVMEGPNSDAPSAIEERGASSSEAKPAKTSAASASPTRVSREFARTLQGLSTAKENQDGFYDRAPRRQFTMSGLMKAVFISALAVGGLRSCSLHRDWVDKTYAANRVDMDLRIMADSIKGLDHSRNPRSPDFQFFVLGMLNLHEAQNPGARGHLDALNRLGEKNIEIMSRLMEKQGRALLPWESRPLYQEYVFTASLHGLNTLASFEDFQEMAGLYETFLAARNKRKAGSLDTQSTPDIERLYQKHAGQPVAARNAALREAARKAGKDFLTSIAVLAAASAAWLLRGFLTRLLLRPIRRAGAWFSGNS